MRPRASRDLTKNAEKLDDFLATWSDEPARTSPRPPERIDSFIANNEDNFKPALADLRQVAQQAQCHVRPGDPDRAQIGHRPVLLRSHPARLRARRTRPSLQGPGARVTRTPTTDIGQAVRRINVLAADLELLTSKLRDGRGGLNTDGTLQKLLTQPELHDNLNTMAISATQALAQLRAALSSDPRPFVEKVSRSPFPHSTRGAFQNR